jgi:hypothetical protein
MKVGTISRRRERHPEAEGNVDEDEKRNEKEENETAAAEDSSTSNRVYTSLFQHALVSIPSRVYVNLAPPSQSSLASLRPTLIQTRPSLSSSISPSSSSSFSSLFFFFFLFLSFSVLLLFRSCVFQDLFSHSNSPFYPPPSLSDDSTWPDRIDFPSVRYADRALIGIFHTPQPSPSVAVVHTLKSSIHGVVVMRYSTNIHKR